MQYRVSLEGIWYLDVDVEANSLEEAEDVACESFCECDLSETEYDIRKAKAHEIDW